MVRVARLSELLVDAGAAYRLTRLVTGDTITERLRDRVDAAVPAGTEWHETPHGYLAELVTCPWCVSVYAAAGVVFMRRRFPKLWQPIAEALTLAAIAANVQTREP